MKLLPSLLYPDFDQFSERFAQCVDLGGQVHIDFADGEFVANRLPSIDKVISLHGQIEIEAHFMIQQPTAWVQSALTDNRFKTLIVHAESDFDLEGLSTQVRHSGRKFGLALKPQTSVDQIADSIELIDQVLVLLVDPGFNGSPFIPEMVQKIYEIRQRFPDLIVEADGGMNPETLSLVKAAGAHHAAIGSYLHQKDLKPNLDRLRQLLDSENQ